jgi:hypothetical protein
MTPEIFKRLFAHVGVFPPFLDIVQAFGFKLGEEDENYGGYHQRIYHQSDDQFSSQNISFGAPPLCTVHTHMYHF